MQRVQRSHYRLCGAINQRTELRICSAEVAKFMGQHGTNLRDRHRLQQWITNRKHAVSASSKERATLHHPRVYIRNQIHLGWKFLPRLPGDVLDQVEQQWSVRIL